VSRTFADDEALLTEALVDVLLADEGPEALARLRRAVELARGARAGRTDDADALQQLVADLDLDAAAALVQSLTRWFQLVNLAEDNERIRRLRTREAAAPQEPRSGSIREAVLRHRAAGGSAEQLGTLLAHAELRLVLTAHPTEARRRTVLDKQARIFDELRTLDQTAPRPDDLRRARERIRATVEELWGSDDLRATGLDVLDEVQAGLLPFERTLAAVVPEVYRDVDAAIAEAYPGCEITVPPLLTFGTWIAGDRDGNPNVTPEITLEALDLMRDRCLRFLEERVALVAGRISLSERVTGAAPGLDPLLAHGELAFPDLARR
jgi:phosphoenolpyruvate carboxylase